MQPGELLEIHQTPGADAGATHLLKKMDPDTARKNGHSAPRPSTVGRKSGESVRRPRFSRQVERNLARLSRSGGKTTWASPGASRGAIGVTTFFTARCD